MALVLGSAACHRTSPAAPTPSAAVPPKAAHARDHEAGRGQAPAGALEVLVNGRPAAAWSPEQVAAARPVSMTNQNGEQRDGWPLKALTRSLVGEKARVVAIASEDERVTIDEKSWNDPARTLVLQLSHRGEYKARWLQGAASDEAFLKHVRRIEVVQ